MRIQALLLSVSLLAAPAVAQEFKPRDHLELGRAMRTLFELQGKKDDSKAQQAVQDILVRVGKSGGVKDDVKALQLALKKTTDLHLAAYQSLELKNLKAEEIVKRDVPQSKPYQYAVRTPKDYKVSTGPYPLLIVVPGVKDSKPWDPELFLGAEMLESEYREGYLMLVIPMPEDMKLWNVGKAEGAKSGVELLMRSLADVRSLYSVDYDRVYLFGRDAGVETCLTVAGMFPHLFAGVVGKSGDSGAAVGDNLGNLPSLLVAAGAQATALEEKNKSAGFANCTLKPEATAADIAAWLKAHPRAANPSKVSLTPGSPIPNRVYWLEVPPVQGEPGIAVAASIDRATNSIQVTAKGVDQISLYFNDLLCDLDQPIKVTINGQTQEVVLPRSLELFLQLLSRQVCDPGRVYVAKYVFAVPR